MTKKLIFLAVGILLLFAVTQAEEPWESSLLTYSEVEKAKEDTLTGKWRMAQDSWFGKDKIEHRLGGMWLSGIALWGFDMKRSEVLPLVSVMALSWEVKDGFWPWEKHGWLGGDGFSYKDAIWTIIGGATLCLIVGED